MTVTCDYVAYAVADNHGHTWSCILQEEDSRVTVFDMQSDDGEELEWEDGKVWRLPDWCKENGLRCTRIEGTITLDV